MIAQRHPARRATHAAAAVTLLLTCGCSFEPRLGKSTLPVPERWPLPATTAASTVTSLAATGNSANDAKTVAAANVMDVGYKDFFVDPRLQQLIDLALANSRDLRVAVGNAELARSQYRLQRLALLPVVNLNGEYSRSRTPSALTGLPTPLEQHYYSVTAGTASYELDLFGQIRSQTHAALESYLSQEESRRSVELVLVASIADAWLSLAADHELRDLAAKTLDAQQKNMDLADQRHQLGAVSGLDVAQARTAVESARSDVARYDGLVAQDLDALRLLLGTEPAPAMLATTLPEHFIKQEALPANLPSTVLLRRPDVRAAEHTLESANANIGAARSAFMPQINLTGSLGFASTALGSLFSHQASSWNFTPAVSVPIFQVGQLRANLAASRAKESIALAQYEKALQSSFRDVADALALASALDRQHQAQQDLVSAARTAEELSVARYKGGKDSFLNVLDANRSRYAAEQSLVAVRSSELQNRVNLYKALGGGWLP